MDLTGSDATPATPIAPPDRALDEAVLVELSEDLDDHNGLALQELISNYVDEASSWMQDLSAALRTGDLWRVRTISHTWKSSSAALGATALAALLSQAEEASRNSPGELAPLAPQIEREHARATAALLTHQHPEAVRD